MANLTHIVAMTAAVVAFATPAFSDEKGDAGAVASAEKVPSGAEVAELEEENDDPPFTCGFDNDLFSAYVFRNAVFGDELVWQPCVWAEFNVADWFSLGGSVWQNWDLTANPKKMGRPRAMNETDFNIHVARSLWTSEDEAYVLNLELGHDFFTYRQQEDVPNDYELYLKLSFANPFVDVYGQFAECYNPVVSPFFELGLNKEMTLAEMFSSEDDFLGRWTVAANWSLSLASGKYFSNYYYGFLPEGEYDPESGEYEDERRLSNGIGGTTIRGTVSYQVCEHFTLGLVIAYTSSLSGEIDDALDYNGYGSMYKRLVWGGLQAKLEF